LSREAFESRKIRIDGSQVSRDDQEMPVYIVITIKPGKNLIKGGINPLVGIHENRTDEK
jgi:hypothetical protein